MGDELVVHRFDRLGRSTRDILNLVHELDKKSASLNILEPEITTAGDIDRMLITVPGMVSDMELKFIKDRQGSPICYSPILASHLVTTSRATMLAMIA